MKDAVGKKYAPCPPSPRTCLLPSRFLSHAPPAPFLLSFSRRCRTLIVPITSDRGLCGGVNNQVGKVVLTMHADLAKQGTNADVFIIGEKGRPLLRRRLEANIVATVSDLWKVVDSWGKGCGGGWGGGGGGEGAHSNLSKRHALCMS
jgi:hypothetical protein